MILGSFLSPTCFRLYDESAPKSFCVDLPDSFEPLPGDALKDATHGSLQVQFENEGLLIRYHGKKVLHASPFSE